MSEHHEHADARTREIAAHCCSCYWENVPPRDGERPTVVCGYHATREAEVERLRSALSDLLEGAENMRSYVPNYFAQKWRHDEALDRAREALEAGER